MSPRSLVLVSVLACLSGCAFSSRVTPAKGAPTFAEPAESVTLAKTPPPGAALLGTIDAQGNQFQDSDDCAKRLQSDAKKLGASHVVVTRMGRRNVQGYGAMCSGEAYR